jgi:transglutaminase-like putative cysteine protease
MYDVKQFMPSLYAMALLSIAGFSFAADSTTLLWAIGTLAIIFNAWLVWSQRFRPMPRFLSNVITIVAGIYVIHEVFTTAGTHVLIIASGEFLMLLQVVKLWEQRANRDYAMVLVLSLLLMVAAAISTSSLIFGIMLAVFLFLAFYCCLLFHLKVEADAAKAAIAVPERKISPAILKQDQRHFSKSMRRMTVIISAISIFVAVVVFIVFPRDVGANLLGPEQFKATQSLVGFTDEVSFQSFARIQQQQAIVAYVKLTHNDVPVRGGSLLLRGITLDSYLGKQGAWRWVRWPRNDSRDERFRIMPGMGDEPIKEPKTTLYRHELTHEYPKTTLGHRGVPLPADRWKQDITLLPTGTNVLFSLAGPISMQSQQPISFNFSSRDGDMWTNDENSRDHPATAVTYQVLASGSLGADPPLAVSGTDPRETDGPIPKEIRDYALRQDVSGADARGSLALQRYERYKQNHAPAAISGAQLPDFPDIGPDESVAAADDLDEQIAGNIERHLKNNFAYTLDLTDVKTIEGRDPLAAFLYDFKKGHCEYFAGAMTLMCQSLGMKARMCAGFRCDEYNATPGADYFIVRQSHAHVWVEVFTKNGWKTFDPTSDRDSIEQARKAGFWQTVKHFFNFLEFGYGKSVIAYTNDDRTNLVQRAETAMIRATVHSTRRFDRIRRHGFVRWFGTTWVGQMSESILDLAIALLAVICVGFLLHFAWRRWSLGRRAARIGLNSLPADEQQRLARQLEFYDELLRLLARRRISRLPHQTPLEFSQSLLFLPAGAYETIGRLTSLFYKIRYGGAVLSHARQKNLATVIQKLTGELEGR